jgi:hypothetical protein
MMDGGVGGGGGIGWVGGWLAQRRAVRRSFDAVEGMMSESGIPIPPRPMSQAKIFWIGFACGLLLGLLIGLMGIDLKDYKQREYREHRSSENAPSFKPVHPNISLFSQPL